MKKATKRKAASKPKPKRKAVEKSSPFLIRRQSDAAAFFGINPNTLTEWLKRAGIDRGRMGGVPLDELAKWHVKYTSKNQTDEELADLRREQQRQANRKLIRINNEAEGELVNKLIVASVLRQFFAWAKSRIESWPPELASSFPPECRDEQTILLTNQVERLCHAFAKDGRDLISTLGTDE